MVDQSVKANSVYSKLLFPKSLQKGDMFSSRPRDRNVRAFMSVSNVNSTVAALLRFRKHPIAVIADIEAMFHQVQVAPRDRDALHFLS